MNLKKILIFILCGLILSCSSRHESKEVEIVKVTEISKDIKLPKQIFLEIEKEISAELKGMSATYVFVPLQVKLAQDNSQALKKQEAIYSFPKGGGLLDFKTLVKGQGSFYLSFPKEQFLELPDLEHLFYISDTMTRNIDGEVYGLGCNRWVDLKKQFTKMQQDQFLKVNTTDHRHLFVLQGVYVFVFRKASQVYLSQLTITDSSYRNSECSGEGQGKS